MEGVENTKPQQTPKTKRSIVSRNENGDVVQITVSSMTVDLPSPQGSSAENEERMSIEIISINIDTRDGFVPDCFFLEKESKLETLLHPSITPVHGLKYVHVCVCL